VSAIDILSSIEVGKVDLGHGFQEFHDSRETRTAGEAQA
jgi:hypothetical protein